MPTRVFFGHASEDKPLVEQVYTGVIERFPDMEPWLDKYEIRGGDQLIDKIVEGIERADKFLIFLSATSIQKPWVLAELRKAITREIQGLEPGFVIPVKLGVITTFPAFLETKKYIDLQELTREEWLNEIRAAVWGTPVAASAQPQENLEVQVVQASDVPSALIAVFTPRFWAEDIGFKLTTNQIIREAQYGFPGRHGMAQLATRSLQAEFEYGIRLYNEKLAPPHLFTMSVRFDAGVDPVAALSDVSRWDGTGGTDDGIAFVSFGRQ